MALNLRDAREWIGRARDHSATIEAVYRKWVESRGIGIVCHRDAEVMRWEFDAAITAEPSTNLSVLAGEVFDALRKALDYIAWQVYVSGSARSERQDNRVYFPIVAEAAGWEKQLGSKVPGAAKLYAEALRASQPFAQDDRGRSLLPTLAAFINRDKHRRLSLFATGVSKASARAPQFADDLHIDHCGDLAVPVVSCGGGAAGDAREGAGDGRRYAGDGELLRLVRGASAHRSR